MSNGKGELAKPMARLHEPGDDPPAETTVSKGDPADEIAEGKTGVATPVADSSSINGGEQKFGSVVYGDFDEPGPDFVPFSSIDISDPTWSPTAPRRVRKVSGNDPAEERPAAPGPAGAADSSTTTSKASHEPVRYIHKEGPPPGYRKVGRLTGYYVREPEPGAPRRRTRHDVFLEEGPAAARAFDKKQAEYPDSEIPTHNDEPPPGFQWNSPRKNAIVRIPGNLSLPASFQLPSQGGEEATAAEDRSTTVPALAAEPVGNMPLANKGAPTEAPVKTADNSFDSPNVIVAQPETIATSVTVPVQDSDFDGSWSGWDDRPDDATREPEPGVEVEPVDETGFDEFAPPVDWDDDREGNNVTTKAAPAKPIPVVVVPTKPPHSIFRKKAAAVAPVETPQTGNLSVVTETAGNSTPASTEPSPQPRRKVVPFISNDRAPVPQNLTPAETLALLNKKHFIVGNEGGKAFVVSESIDPVTGHHSLDYSTAADFRLRYSNQFVRVTEGDKEKWKRVADFWLGHPARRQYDRTIFAPGTQLEPQFYNTFHGFGVTPRKGNCWRFWWHLYMVLCRKNRKHYLYIKRWMAHLVQRPGELPGVALVIRGRQGTGKTIFVSQLARIVGRYFLSLTRVEQLAGRFDAHLRDVLLVVASEALWGGDRASEGSIKGMVTDAETSTEGKFKDLVGGQRNYKRVIVTSNEDWPVPVDLDDRRYLCLETSDAHKEDTAYFAALVAQMENGGLEALMDQLTRMDLTGFNVRRKPASRFDFDLKIRSASPIVKWWADRLYEGRTFSFVGHAKPDWETTPSKRTLFEDYLDFTKDHKLHALTHAAFGKALSRLLPSGHLAETRPKSDDETKLRERRYILPTLDQCRKAFEVMTKSGPEIWLTGNDV